MLTMYTLHVFFLALKLEVELWAENIPYMLDLLPRSVTLTTRIITFLVGNPYRLLFATGIRGRGLDPTYMKHMDHCLHYVASTKLPQPVHFMEKRH